MSAAVTRQLLADVSRDGKRVVGRAIARKAAAERRRRRRERQGKGGAGVDEEAEAQAEVSSSSDESGDGSSSEREEAEAEVSRQRTKVTGRKRDRFGRVGDESEEEDGQADGPEEEQKETEDARAKRVAEFAKTSGAVARSQLRRRKEQHVLQNALSVLTVGKSRTAQATKRKAKKRRRRQPGFV